MVAAKDAEKLTPPPRPNCGGCAIFEHRAVTQVALDRGAPAGGLCHFMPEPVRKLPNDWCAQHPAFLDWAWAQREAAAPTEAAQKEAK